MHIVLFFKQNKKLHQNFQNNTEVVLHFNFGYNQNDFKVVKKMVE